MKTDAIIRQLKTTNADIVSADGVLVEERRLVMRDEDRCISAIVEAHTLQTASAYDIVLWPSARVRQNFAKTATSGIARRRAFRVDHCSSKPLANNLDARNLSRWSH